MPIANEKRKEYQEADPYPHIIFEDFLESRAAEAALSEFPSPDSSDWNYYIHLNEKKLGKNARDSFPETIGAIIDELNSSRFIEFLTALTGIQGLFKDESLEGGGMHQIVPGGFLNVHADFTVHPHHQDWERRINVLVYLNKNWEDRYGGHLELWDKQMKACVKKVAPMFNRCVIFSTNADSYHGHPNPLATPSGFTRKSLALYYFTKTTTKARSTEYKSRPEDGILKRMGIYLDKMGLRYYDLLKRKLKFDDRTASRILKAVSGILSRKR